MDEEQLMQALCDDTASLSVQDMEHILIMAREKGYELGGLAESFSKRYVEPPVHQPNSVRLSNSYHRQNVIDDAREVYSEREGEFLHTAEPPTTIRTMKIVRSRDLASTVPSVVHFCPTKKDIIIIMPHNHTGNPDEEPDFSVDMNGNFPPNTCQYVNIGTCNVVLSDRDGVPFIDEHYNTRVQSGDSLLLPPGERVTICKLINARVIRNKL